MKKTKSFQKKPTKHHENTREGLLIAHFGARADILDANNQLIHCHLRKNLEPVITGDQVLWQPESDNAGVIVDYLPRKSLLARPERHGKMKLLAANIDIMVIVTAPPPALSEYLIDRYLIAAENLHITPIILLNKMDLLTDNHRADVMARLAVYEKIGYRVLYSSTYTQDGLTELVNFLQNKTCVLVGISGVGKSSIISSFIPEQIIKVAETSAAGTGKHTTTITRLYHLPQGGKLIDSPGVREFNLWNMDPHDILKGFIEFKPFLNQCKFRNCQHGKEPECAISTAIAEGKISARRVDSYRELLKKE